jgi:hypothetical protein
MARGGYGHGSGVPLKDRARAAESSPVRTPTPYPGRHCLVTVPVDGSQSRPGLLLEWRRTDGGWEGRVVYVAELRSGKFATVEEWLRSALLEPVD